MSFPNIPEHIIPHIDLSLEDSVNLLLSSIAMEEESLSRLMDAETCKLLHVLKESGCKNPVQEILKVNKSVNSTIKNMVRLQMLLQMKLEDVKELVPCIPTTTSTTTCSYTKTSTTKCPATTCCVPVKMPCLPPHGCRIIGDAKGTILDRDCLGFGGIAELHIHIDGIDYKNRSLRFLTKGNEKELYFDAFTYHIKPVNNSSCYGNIHLDGKGNLTVKEQGCKPKLCPAEFTLTLKENPCAYPAFRMEIVALNGTFRYNSGFITVNTDTPECSLFICC